MMDIIWDTPTALYFLWLVVPVALLLMWAQRRRLRAARRFADPAMAERLMPVLEGPRPWVRGGLVVAALLCLGVALARPRWGVYFETVHQRGADVMVLLDVSRSMLAADVAPDRLERAKSDIRDLLRKLRGERVGLVAFAGRPAVACPLTTDQGFFRFVLDDIGPDAAPRGGTAIGDAIREGLRTMEERRDRDQAMLLITDGEDHDSYPREAAAAAAERGVKIFTVGLGDPVEGERVPLEGADGSRGFLKYKGQVVWTKMDERLLQEIALTTGGAYVPAKTQVYDLGEIYESHLAGLSGGEISAEKRKRYRERFQLFVALGLLALLIERLVGPYPRRPVPGRTLRPAASAVGRVLILAALLAGGGLVGQARASDPAGATRRGVEQFAAGRFDEALDAFKEADVARPEDRVVAFDMAVARHALGDLDEATSLYNEAARARTPELSARAHYDLGCLAVDRARAVFGEHPEQAQAEQRQEGLGFLGQAVLSYRACLAVQPDHAKARHNLEVIRLWIKNMTDLWAQQDRQKARDEMDLIGFLEMLMQSQSGLRSRLTETSRQEDSPRRRQQVSELARDQRQLAEEIETLKSKIEDKLAQSAKAQAGGSGGAGGPGGQPAAGAPANGAADDRVAQARALLEGLADQANEAMGKAADDIEGARFEGADGFQRQAYSALDQIWRTVVPFPKVLSEAIEGQTTIRDATASRVEEEPDPEEDPETVLGALAEQQTRTAELAALLPLKAEQMRPQVEAMAAAGQAASGQPPAPSGQAAGAPGSTGDDERAQQTAERAKAMRRALDKAKELAPRAAEQARGAATDLAEAKPDQALPQEEEALDLLEEIAREMPKDKSQDQQDKQDDSGKNPDQQDQKNEQQQNPQNQQQQPRQKMSREQLEAMLRKAEEREREARERRHQLMRGLASPAKVERDW